MSRTPAYCARRLCRKDMLKLGHAGIRTDGEVLGSDPRDHLRPRKFREDQEGTDLSMMRCSSGLEASTHPRVSL